MIKKFIFAFMAMVMLTGVSFGQERGCILLPKGLENIIKDQVILINNPFGKGNRIEPQSETAMIDYLVGFEKELKNVLKDPIVSPQKEAQAKQYLKDMENNTNFKWLKTLMAKNSNDYNQIRAQIKSKLSNTSDKETIKFLVLVDYQLQICKYYEASFNNVYSKWGIDWGCVGTWTGAGGAIGAEVGGLGAVPGAVIGFAIGMLGCDE